MNLDYFFGVNKKHQCLTTALNSRLGCRMISTPLTTGLAGAVDWWDPQVGRACVKDDAEGLRGGADGDNSIVGQLEGCEKTCMQELTSTSITCSKTYTVSVCLSTFNYLQNVMQYVIYCTTEWKGETVGWIKSKSDSRQRRLSWAQHHSGWTWPLGCMGAASCIPPTILSPAGFASQSCPWSGAS